jgi:hypothetical protein
MFGLLFFSFLFALYLASLPIDQFVDRESYLSYASYSLPIFLNRSSHGILTFFFNEPLFGAVNVILTSLFEVETTLRLIIFFSAFTTFYIVLLNSEPKYILLSLLFLLLPQVLKNNIIHLRQGLAISFFIWGWFSSNGRKKKILFFCSALTHSSFIIVLFGLFLIRFIREFKFSTDLRMTIFVLLSLFIGVFSFPLADMLGARQVDNYETVVSEASGFGFIFWFGILIIFISQGKRFFLHNTHSFLFLSLYLGTYFFLPVSGSILESVLILILMSSHELKNYKKWMFIFAYLSYFILTWYPRLFKPGFGWSILNYQ